MRFIWVMILAVAVWPASAFARPYRDSDYQLFSQEQAAVQATLPRGWSLQRRAPVQEDGFLGITLFLVGPKSTAATTPLFGHPRKGALREQIEVTLWPGYYQPHRANLFTQLARLGMDGDSLEPFAGNSRVKITSGTGFGAYTTPRSWPTWRGDLQRALHLQPIPPSAHELQREEDQRRLTAKFRLDTPGIAIAWAEEQMRKNGFVPRAKPFVRQHEDTYVIFWPNTHGFDAIVTVSKKTKLVQSFVWDGGPDGPHQSTGPRN